LRPVPSIARGADPFPACTVAAHLNTVQMYHDHSGSGTRARHHLYRHRGGPAAHCARSRVQIIQVGLQVRRSGWQRTADHQAVPDRIRRSRSVMCLVGAACRSWRFRLAAV